MNDLLLFSSLVPDIANLAFPPSTKEQLSAVFVVALIIIALSFAVFCIWSFFKSYSQISKLNKVLKEHDSKTVFINRRDIKNAADKINTTVGHLWDEFDETLVEIREDDTTRLYNTLDSAHFFNESTLAKGITQNRLVAAVPGFLTAVGVIGTFFGLQLGLADLNLSNNVSVEEMKQGVGGVIDGAKVAFITSVWGVGLSVLFNFGEKFLEQRVRAKISVLQNCIDDIFPRLSAEYLLNESTNLARSSNQTLSGLAEAIGEKLTSTVQELSVGMQDAITSSLETMLKPAIGQMVTNANEGSEKALGSLIEAFQEKFGELGQEQKKGIDEASQAFTAASNGLSTQLNSFVTNAQSNQQKADERQKQLVESIDSTVKGLLASNAEASKSLIDELKQWVSEVQGQLDAFRTSGNAQFAQSKQQLEEQLKAQQEQLNQWLQTMNQQLDGQATESQEREKERLDKLTTALDGLLTQLSESSTEAQKNTSENVQSITNATNAHLQKLEETTGAQILKLVNSIDALTKSSEILLTENSNAVTRITTASESLQSKLQPIAETHKEAAASLQTSSVNLVNAANAFGLVQQSLSGASSQLSSSLEAASSESLKVAQAYGEHKEAIASLTGQLQSGIEAYQQAASSLQAVFDASNTTFSNLSQAQKDFLQEQEAQIGALSNKLAKLLQDYAEQANANTTQHLTVWGQSTADFAGSMTETVNALNSIVDEMQDKLGA